MQEKQSKLSQDQIRAFYHDSFVESQVKDFIQLIGTSSNSWQKKVVDVGGGCGYFAKALQDSTSFEVRVIDTDSQSVAYCRQAGLDASVDDALNPTPAGDEFVVCFNLVLHHLVGATEAETRNLQRRALSAWGKRAPSIFVNEYIYESFFLPDISGWLIFQITGNAYLSRFCRLISKIAPSLSANTFGVGVRFRSHVEWREMFQDLGFDIAGTVKGRREGISLPRRLLLIKNCRRDSFLLKPRISSDE